ncbi:MAG: 6-bladed beta-propeller [Rikenellaceae bacterium]|nr:6-bladed beta-propeller [Rikenellaceae bacterium]
MKKSVTLFQCAVLLFSSSLLISCHSEKRAANNIIDIAAAINDARVVNLSEIAEEITYIPFETTDSSLVTEPRGARQLFIYENETFYTGNRGTFKLFDKKGKFLRSFNREGRGPQEFVYGIFDGIDPISGNLKVEISHPLSIIEYSDKGDFVSKVLAPTDSVFHGMYSNIAKIGDNRYIANFFDSKKTSDFCAYIFDSLSNIVAKVPTPKFEIPISDISSISIGSSQSTDSQEKVLILHFYMFKNQPRINISSCDYILNINADNTVDTLYKINLGEYKITNANREKAKAKDAKFIRVSDLMLETENQVIFKSVDLRGLNNDPMVTSETKSMYKSSMTMFDKNSGKVTIMHMPENNSQGFKEDLQGGPAFLPKSVSNDGKILIGYASAMDLKMYVEEHECSDELEKLGAKLDENDNLVAILVKLKEN